MSASTASARPNTFADALLDPERPCPAGLRAWNGSDPSRRFAVYRNNVVTSLIVALADTFPVVQALVGRDFFASMARRFASRHPPRSPVLTQYGQHFPEFIASFEPAGDLPYLPDVARLEWLRVVAFHAADATSIAREEIARRLGTPQSLAAATLRLHPSLAVLRSDFAVVSLWAVHQGVGDIAEVDPMRSEAALVLRQDDVTLVLAIAADDAAFIAALAAGAPLAEAVAAVPAAPPDAGFDPTSALSLLIRHGAITAWHPPRSTDR